MKTIAFCILTLALACCHNYSGKESSLALVERYYKGLNTSNYAMVSSCVFDTLKMFESEWDLQLTFDENKFHDWYRWDSVFEPNYKIVEIEQRIDSVFATILKTDKRIQLLHHRPLKYKTCYKIKSEGLFAIYRLQYIDADWELWQKNRMEFIQWVEQNHPELSGFMDVQNETYGKLYLKALELYLKR